ncbi:hypothetical protein T12_6612 [Trichinella patagoniensis]|uniref:Uncharacterized protein n=1 Tax=Trichinella patagoniensis TaxID=990121 RepID=A0A0V0ZBQ2_9BILA|nr:hypothetical protein T12_6612 [Trichinella patagoniensis]
MLILYFIVEVCINNAFLLMRHKQSYQKTKKRFMKSFQLVKHIEMSYKPIKSIKMVRAMTSKIYAKPLPFM